MQVETIMADAQNFCGEIHEIEEKVGWWEIEMLYHHFLINTFWLIPTSNHLDHKHGSPPIILDQLKYFETDHGSSTHFGPASIKRLWKSPESTWTCFASPKNQIVQELLWSDTPQTSPMEPRKPVGRMNLQSELFLVFLVWVRNG